jgi:hypothetical protein
VEYNVSMVEIIYIYCLSGENEYAKRNSLEDKGLNLKSPLYFFPYRSRYKLRESR